MSKISVIIPVYNTGKYVEKCLSSVLSQKNKDFEVIVVNDGSTDNSEEIINKIIINNSNKIKYFLKSNGGLSDARNFGVQKATGEYLCFLDSDDYISDNLFEELQRYILQKVDLIKYKCIKVDENSNIIEKVKGPIFKTITGEEGFSKLFGTDILLETACLYLYKKEFFVKNNFKFPVNKYHEDWAIVPFIIIKSSSMISTDIYGYYYVQSENSITRNNIDEKIYIRAIHMLEHYDNMLYRLQKENINKYSVENLKIYMTNCIILKLNELPEKYHKQYINEIKKRKLCKNIKVRNIKQLIKRIVLKINIKLYLKLR